MTRVAAVTIKDDRVALIERRRSEALDYVFPGCDVSIDDTAEVAAIREVKRTLGLDVSIGRLVADIDSDGETQLFFLAEVSTDAKASSIAQSDDRAVWLPIFGLTALPVQPKAVALLVEFSGNGWPHGVLTLTERAPQTSRTRERVPV